MTDEAFMREALVEAEAAYARGEAPVGAVVVLDDRVIARAGNNTLQQHDPTAHAEVEAIRQACAHLGVRKLPDCTLYTTLFPCPMCEMVIKEVRIARVLYGGRTFRWVREVKFGHTAFEPQGPLLDDECRGLFERMLIDNGRNDILEYEDAPA